MSLLEERPTPGIEYTRSVGTKAQELLTDLRAKKGRESQLMSSSTNDLRTMLLARKSPEDRAFLADVADFTELAHVGQYRRDGKTPHGDHSYRVAVRLSDRGVGTRLQADALLHDAGEDWDESLPTGRLGTPEEYKSEFYKHFKERGYNDSLVDDLYHTTLVMDKRGKTPQEYKQGLIVAKKEIIKIYDRGVDNTRADIARLGTTLDEGDYELVPLLVSEAEKSRRKAADLRECLHTLPPHEKKFATEDLEVTIQASQLITESLLVTELPIPRKKDIFPNSRGQA